MTRMKGRGVAWQHSIWDQHAKRCMWHLHNSYSTQHFAMCMFFVNFSLPLPCHTLPFWIYAPWFNCKNTAMMEPKQAVCFAACDGSRIKVKPMGSVGCRSG